MIQSTRSSVGALLLGVTVTVASAPAQQGQNPVAPAGANVIVIKPDSIGETARTVSELIREHVPSATVQRPTGALGAGAYVSLRDGAAVRGDDPLVVVDGVRLLSYMASLDTNSARWTPALIDEIPVSDVERIDVLNGPAAAARYGYDGQRGAIVITTRRPGTGRPAFRSALTTSGANDRGNFTRNLAGVTATGIACPYYAAASGSCSVASTSRYTPILDRSPFRSSQRASLSLGATGGLGALGYAASLGADRGQGTLETDATDRTNGLLRLQLPITEHLRFDASTRATTRGVSLPYEGTGYSLLTRGVGGGPIDCSVATPCGSDSWSHGYSNVSPDFLAQRYSHRRIDRLSQGFGLDAEPNATLGLSTRVMADVLRDRAAALDSAPPEYASYQYTRFGTRESAWRIGAEQSARLLTAFAGAEAASTVTLRFDTERERSSSTEVAFGQYAGFYSSTYHLMRRDRRALAVDQRLEWGSRASAGLGAIVSSTRLREDDHAHRAVDPHADVAFQLLPAGAAMGPLSGLRLRSAFGRTSGQDARAEVDRRWSGVPIPPSTGFWTGPKPKYLPDRSAEFEAGFDASFRAASATLSATAYQRRETIHGLFSIIAPSWNSNAAAGRRVTGLELNGAATPLDAGLARLRLHAGFALAHDRVTRFDLPGRTYQNAFRDALLVIDRGVSWDSWQTGNYAWADANGNGRIESSEVTGTPWNRIAGRRSRPSRIASLRGELTLGHSLTASALLDHVGGFDVFDFEHAVQCIDRVCPALNDPRAPLADQARAVAIVQASTAGYLVPGDATRLRELSLSWESARAATLMRASSFHLSVTAYDVATWSRTKGIDPEIAMPTPGDASDRMWSLVQPIPRTVALRVALQY